MAHRGDYGMLGVKGASASRYPQLEAVLLTEEGFKRSIRYADGFDAALTGVVSVVVMGVVLNLSLTLYRLDRAGLPMRFLWLYLFDVRGPGGTVDALFWAAVWVPVIAVPVMVGLLIARWMTRDGSVFKVCEQYRRGGFVAELVPTDITIFVKDKRGLLFMIAGPGAAAESVQNAVRHMRARVEPKSREARLYLRGLSATVAGADCPAVLAKKADPGLPDGIFITGQLTRRWPVRVAVPVGGDGTRLKLWQLQKDVPLA